MRNEYDITAEEVARGLQASRIREKLEEALDKKDQRQSVFLTKDFDTSLSLIRFFNSRRDLSPAQKRLGISLIRRHAPTDVIKALDIEEPVRTKEVIADDIRKLGSEVVRISNLLREQMDIMNNSEDTDEMERLLSSIDAHTERIKQLNAQILNLRKPTSDDLKQGLRQIKPYFASEIDNVTKFVNRTQSWHGYRDWAYDIVKEILSNYREQLDQETAEILLPILVSEKDRDQFFVVFTPEYVRFLVALATAALEMGLVNPDKMLDQFIATEGRGPRGKNDERFDFREINSWKKICNHVRDKLLKAREKGSFESDAELLNASDYLTSPSAFNSSSRTQLRTPLRTGASSSLKFEAKNYTPLLKRTVLECIKYLASVCDYAKEKDFQGFCASDTRAGHKMAMQESIEDSQMPRAIFWCKKYSGQLPEETLSIIARELQKTSQDSQERQKEYTQKTNLAIARYITVCMVSL